MLSRVLYAGPVVGAVYGVRSVCLVRLRVHAAMGSFAVVLSLFFLGMGLVKVSSTLRYGVGSIGTLIDDGMSDVFSGGIVISGFVNLGDVCSILSSVVFERIIGCSVGGVVWVFGAWRLIRVLAAVACFSGYLIDVSPFPFSRTFVYCFRFLIYLIM